MSECGPSIVKKNVIREHQCGICSPPSLVRLAYREFAAVAPHSMGFNAFLWTCVRDMTKARGLGLQNQLTVHKFSWTCRVSVWTYAISCVSQRLCSVPVPFLMSLPSLIYSSTLWAVGRWRGRGPHSDTKYIYPHAKHR
ncbi:hypothetical protein MHYP_G00043650 [Metynnis hypsauchen]